MTNTKLLEDRIQQSGLKKSFIAACIGVSSATFSALLAGKSEFKVSQVKTVCELLDIKDEETLRAIFFA